MAAKSIFSWLRGINNKSRRAGKKRQPAWRCRLGMEPLEDRLALAMITVTSLADNTTADGQVTLREAIQAAETDAPVDGSTAGIGADSIVFASTLFAGGPQTIDLSIIGDKDTHFGRSAFAINTPVTIQGPTEGLTLAGPGDTGDRDTTMRLFLITAAGNLTLDRLTLTGGRADDDTDGSVGGAIINVLGTLFLTDSTLAGNEASQGGALENEGTAAINRSTMNGNTADSNAGGINNNGTLTLTNSTVSGNAAGDHAGGIFNGGTLTLTNSTVTGNQANCDADTFGNSGGLFQSANGRGTTFLNNSIVAGNFLGTGMIADDISSPTGVDAANSFNNLIGTGGAGGLVNGTNGNIVGVAVASVLHPTLAFNGGPTMTHALIDGPNSAVNAGDNSKVPAGGYDQRGFVRIIGDTVDIGAVERDSVPVPASLVVDYLFDENDGNFAAGDLSLREAIFLAELNPDPQTITFDPDLFASGPQTIDLSFVGDTSEGESAFAVSTPITIKGPEANGLTLSGLSSQRHFLVTGTGHLSVEHLTLALGNTQLSVPGGGGFLNFGTLQVTDSTLSGNSAVFGGGIRNDGTLTVTNSTFSGNIAGGGSGDGFGGGIFNDGTLTVTNSSFTGNSSENIGGGVTNQFGTVTVTNSTISGNSAFIGGGISNMSGTVTVTNSTISGNSAGFGGGISNDDTLTVTNSTISGNSAGEGGGIFNQGTLTVTNSTITGNSTSSRGGGVITSSALALLYNSIVAGNNGPRTGGGTAPNDLDGGVNPSSTHNLIGDASSSGGLTHGSNGNIVGNDGEGVIDIDTVLDTTLALNGGPTKTHALVTGSPAINAGDDSKVPAGVTTDQRGRPRFVGTVDIGAFEVQNQAPTLAVPSAQTAFEDVDLPFNDIAVDDADGDSLTVTLKVDQGTLTLGRTTGLMVSGNGSGEVSLSGSIDDLNAALESLLYRGNLNFNGDDTLRINVGDGSLSTSGEVAINVKSWAQQAMDLSARVDALVAAGVLSAGQGNALKLNLKDNNGDTGKVQAFLNQVRDLFLQGILDDDEAASLLHLGNNLLLSITRR